MDVSNKGGNTEAKPPPDDMLRGVLVTHGAAIARMAESWTRTPSERDDLVEDISLALLTSLPSFRGECPERAFVWRVAQNRALKFAADRKRAQIHDDIDTFDPVAKTPSPHEHVDQKQRLDRLHQALRKLREEQRVLVVLSLEGLSHEEIADVVGGNANSVGVALHRARAALLEAHRNLSTTLGIELLAFSEPNLVS
jgi:RNA polymerase sigma factor (sigma-70 family)